MKFKVKNPYRIVELVAREHIAVVMKLKDKDEVWSTLDHFFWEAFDKIIEVIPDKKKQKLLGKIRTDLRKNTSLENQFIDLDELDRGIK